MKTGNVFRRKINNLALSKEMFVMLQNRERDYATSWKISAANIS
jgi:hypothetical protein